MGKMRLTLMLAVVLITGASGSRRALAAVQTPERAAAAAPAELTAEQVLPICERALEAAIGGRDAKAVVEDAVKRLPEAQRATVLSVCGVYLAGAVSMLKHASEPPAVPAGKQTSI